MSEQFTARVILNDTNVRQGGCTKGDPDNILTTVDRGEYPAIWQCAGQEVVEDHGHGTVRNIWWVLIEIPGGGQGWVSVARTATGHDGKRIPGVPNGATRFCAPDEVFS